MIHPNIILIDASYYVFHRFFATLRWYSFRTNTNKEDYKVMDDEIFVEAYTRHIENDFRDIKKKYGIPHGNTWMIQDCPRSNIWRCDMYPHYKETRTHASTFEPNIFPFTFSYLEKHSERIGIKFLKHPRLEADDCCYIMQQYLVDREYKGMIYILANDNDYLQMVKDNVCVVNKEGKFLKDRGCGNPVTDLKKKILMGDKSDNIPPICNGIGPKTVEKLLNLNDNELEEWIRSKHASEQYKLNRELIDMSRIPLHLFNEVTSTLENLKLI